VRVALYGDSLAWEAEEYVTFALGTTGRVELKTATFGGTAICDWFDRMRADATEFQPHAVIVEFSGNALTSCMQGADTKALTGAPYLAKYRSDALEVVRIFSGTGARVYFAGSPLSRSAADDPDFAGGRINAMYAAVAAEHSDDVAFVDAGAAVLDDGEYTDTLPCLPGEPCGPDGRNVVRAPDGAHFCPGAGGAVEGVTGRCSVYASGAVRYAGAMVAPVIADFAL
jgi:hypothetical protein